jgi:DNA polymerase V
MLLELHKAAGVQSGLFGARDSARRLALMKTMDQLNRSLSRLPCASPQREGREQSWKLRSDHVSQRFTTRWDELLGV